MRALPSQGLEDAASGPPGTGTVTPGECRAAANRASDWLEQALGIKDEPGARNTKVIT